MHTKTVRTLPEAPMAPIVFNLIKVTTDYILKPLFTKLVILALTCELCNSFDDWLESNQSNESSSIIHNSWFNPRIKNLVNKTLRQMNSSTSCNDTNEDSQF